MPGPPESMLRYRSSLSHDVALFGYSEHHPPLSVSYTQAAATSGRKFLEEIISSWPQYRERVSFHRENKAISSTSKNMRSEQHLCSGEGIKDW